MVWYYFIYNIWGLNKIFKQLYALDFISQELPKENEVNFNRISSVSPPNSSNLKKANEIICIHYPQLKYFI